MAVALDKQAPIARVYAESVGTLAAEQGRDDEVLEELEALVAALDASPALERFLASPLVENADQRDALEHGLRGRASDLVVDTLQVMRSKGRLELLRAVALAYREQWMKRRDRVEVRVASAIPLTEEIRASLARAVAQKLGKEPVLVEAVRPELLGGLVVSIGDDRFDSSVATGLARLQQELLERAARELLSDKSFVTNSE